MPGSAAQRTLLYCIDALLYLLCLAGVYHVREKAFLPVERVESGRLIVEAAGADSPLRSGDHIESLDGIAVANFPELEFLCDGRRIGDRVRVGIRRGGTVTAVDALLAPNYSARYILIQVLVGSLYFFLGVYVFARRPGEKAALLFHWNSIAIAAIIMTTWGNYAVAPPGAGQMIRALFSAAYALTPAIFLHFCLTFPVEWKGDLRRAVPWMYGAALLLACALGISFVAATTPPSLPRFGTFETLYDVCRLFFAVGMFSGLAVLLLARRRAWSASERKKHRWILFGLTIATAGYLLLWQIPQLAGIGEFAQEDFIVLISGAAPVTIAIAIVRHRIFDIDLLITRGTVYSAVAAILLLVYAGIIGAVAIVIQRWTLPLSLILPAVAAAAVALLLEPTRRRVQAFVDRRFFRVRYDYREALRSFSEQIGGFYDARRLAEYVIRRIDELLPVERAGFFRFSPANRRLYLLAHRSFDTLVGRGIPLRLEQLRSRLELPVALADQVDPEVSVEAGDRRMFARWHIALILPFISEQKEIVGFIILGRKKAGFRFTREDMDLLQNISTQAGLALGRIILQQQLLLKSEEARHLEELSRMKSLFVSTVSHELKTPLTSIRMFAELLREHPDLPAGTQKQYLDIIEGESERLTRLINNVLHFARIERGGQEYRLAPARLNPLIEQALGNMEYQFRIRRIAVRFDPDPEAGEILADADAVAAAVTNLLSNAIKYSGEAGRVEVSTRRCGDRTAVAVRDYGIGIAPDQQGRIFEPFVRATGPGAPTAEGTGLGLALVRDIMAAHGGSVEVESVPGEGSNFTLRFPIAPVPPADAEAQPS